jgi:BioD-like phosphotransacetylase family protein
MPHPNLLRMLAESGLPVVVSPMDSYSIANRIHSMRIKLQPGDREKIQRVQDLVAAHVDIPRLLAKLGLAA